MPSLLKQLAPINLDSAGTRQRLSSSAVLAETVLVSAESTNAGNIFVGDVSVASNNGIKLAAGQSVELTADNDYMDLREIYFDGSVTNDDIRVSYIAKQN